MNSSVGSSKRRKLATTQDSHDTLLLAPCLNRGWENAIHPILAIGVLW